MQENSDSSSSEEDPCIKESVIDISELTKLNAVTSVENARHMQSGNSSSNSTLVTTSGFCSVVSRQLKTLLDRNVKTNNVWDRKTRQENREVDQGGVRLFSNSKDIKLEESFILESENS